MALFLQQDENRTELQKRLSAELDARAKKKALLDNKAKLPDGVKDSEYLKGTRRTTPLAGAWILILLAIVVLLIVLTVLTTR